MENNIVKFEQVQQEREEKELQELQEGLQDAPITDEDLAEIDKMIQEEKPSAYVVREGTNEVPLDEYLKPVDDAVLTMKDGTKLISMTQSGKTAEYISGVTEHSMQELLSRAVVPITESEFRDLCHETLAAVKAKFGMDKLRSDHVMRLMVQLKPEELYEFLPRKLITSFVEPVTLKANPNQAKEVLTTLVGYMVAAGPESDEFAVYMENQNKLYAVLQALAEKNIEVKDFLSSKETLAEFAKKALENADPRTATYMKYVKSPDAINLYFSYRESTNRAFVNAYTDLRNNYTDPIELEAIDHEIEEAAATADMYASVLKLESFTQVCDNFLQEQKNGKRNAKQNFEKMARKYLEKLLKSNLDYPFPGYATTIHNAAELYINYQKHYREQAANYNKFVERANAEQTEQLPIIADSKLFADVLLIVMGRLQKKLLKEPVDYRKKRAVVTYFEMMCRLCTDIFTTAKVVALLQPIMELAN